MFCRLRQTRSRRSVAEPCTGVGVTTHSVCIARVEKRRSGPSIRAILPDTRRIRRVNARKRSSNSFNRSCRRRLVIIIASLRDLLTQLTNYLLPNNVPKNRRILNHLKHLCHLYRFIYNSYTVRGIVVARRILLSCTHSYDVQLHTYLRYVQLYVYHRYEVVRCTSSFHQVDLVHVV